MAANSSSMTAVMGVWVMRTLCDLLLDAVFEDEEVVGFEAGDELVGLVEDDVDVEVDDGDVDAEGVGLAVGVLDLGLGGGGGAAAGSSAPSSS